MTPFLVENMYIYMDRKKYMSPNVPGHGIKIFSTFEIIKHEDKQFKNTTDFIFFSMAY